MAIETLVTAHPADAPASAERLFSCAPAAQLDRLVVIADGGDATTGIQAAIDATISDPLAYPEVAYWLWKGAGKCEALRLPDDDELFPAIIYPLCALGKQAAP